MQIKASDIQIGDTVIVPNYGQKTVTFIKKSRRYPGFVEIQWAFTPGQSCAANIKANDLIEKV